MVVSSAALAVLLGVTSVTATFAAEVGDVDALAVQLREGETQREREVAALRLASRPQAAAAEVLLATLRDPTDPAGRLAAARALARYADPDDTRWIDPLFAVLSNGVDDNLAAAVGDALANYALRPAVTARLGQLAQDNGKIAARLAALDALSAAPTMQAATAIAALLDDAEPRVAQAAADALGEMAALDDTDRGVVAAWMADRIERGDFDDVVLRNRALRAQRQQADLLETRATLRRALAEQYRLADDKAALLDQFLTSSDANVRLLGVELVFKAATETGSVPAAVTPRVIALVGDDRAAVRRQAAAALGVLNDPAATDALLTQIGQEPDASVRAALAAAVGPLRDVRVVEPLMGLLRDPSPQVISAACRSLRRLGPTVRRDDPALARAVADETEDLIVNRTRRGDGTLREHAVEAYAAVAGGDGTAVLTKLLLARPREDDGVLVAALGGLGRFGDERAGDAVAELAGHESARVRQAAVAAMVQTSAAFERADLLRQRLDEDAEPSAAVREEAWKSLTALMPRAPEAQLAAWPERFRDEPLRELAVLRVLAEMAAERGDVEAQGYRLQQIGDLQASIGRWGEAAASLRASLDLVKDRPDTQPVVLLSRSGGLLTALLRNKSYDAALEFAAELIREDPQNRGDVGNRIRQETERLFAANELADARRLVEAALSMDPPLEPVYVERLRETGDRIRLREEAGSGGQTPAQLTSLDRG
ncbi:MAG: HEAT repeat domain-containing protein [Planctomycetota bacterium]